MRRLGILLLLAIGIGLSANSSTESLPPFRVPDCLGVNIHFVEPQEDQLDMIREAGFGLIRMDLGWEHVEKTKGEYDFSGYERLTQSLHKRGMTPLYILDYSNRLYEEERSVETVEGRQAFARFAAAAVKTLSTRPILWEIWNEPNIKQFWEEPNPASYVLLVEEAVKAMRSVDPKCTVLAPATSQIPFDFLEACFDRGLLRWIDAVTVHPYRTKPPESALEDYAQLRGMMDRYSGGENKPILSGEWGYSLHRYRDLNVDEHMQAQFLARQFLTNFLAGVRLSIWYDWHDDGPDPEEREHNFGTVKQDFTPKKAYKAAQVFNRQLKGMRLIRSHFDSGSQVYWAVFGNGNTPRAIAGWTTGDPIDAALWQGRPKGDAVTMLGETVALRQTNGRWVVPLSQDPIYIHLR